MTLKKEIIERIEKIEAKYEAMGQDMESYLDGLLYANSLTYWDYIHLETLLSIQNTRTDFPDEKIFITFHQVCELYFNLIIQQLSRILSHELEDEGFVKIGLQRCNRYFQHLSDSFSVMIDGMDVEEFRKFRMALLPASGFQSVQFRQIEILSTSIYQLLSPNFRDTLANEQDLEKLYEHIYWKFGNLELKTSKKTLTLEMFEKKYDDNLLELVDYCQNNNLYSLLVDGQHDSIHPSLKDELKQYDYAVNILWRKRHHHSAVKYLQKSPEAIKATGGTNWQQYLPPKSQNICFFPELWEEDMAEFKSSC